MKLDNIRSRNEFMDLKNKDMIKFKKESPKKWIKEACIVQCPEYCRSGYQIAFWGGENWETDDGDTITKYVIGWAILNVAQ